MRYRNKLGIDLFNNPLKRNRELLDEKNLLESTWYDNEAQDYIEQLEGAGGLMPIDRDFEEWFAAYADDPGMSLPFDRDFVYFNSFPKKRGMRILELGFGNGCLTRFWLRRGHDVVSIDLSRAYGNFLKRSHSESLPVVSCAEILPCRDNAFDIVTAFVSLHHFNLDLCLPEIHRVLKDNGLGLFLEPLGDSRLFYLLRQLIPVADNESPAGGGLRYAELKAKLAGAGFSFSIEKFELFTRLERLPHLRRAQNQMRKMDHILLKSIPFLGRIARSVVIKIEKSSGMGPRRADQ